MRFYQVVNLSNDLLTKNIRDYLTNFPNASLFYDDEQIQRIIRRKRHYNNHLFQILALEIDEKLTIIEDGLTELKTYRNFESMLPKFAKHSIKYGYLTEIELALHFAQSGYNLDFEPECEGLEGDRRPEFKIWRGSDPEIYVEVKTVLPPQQLLDFEQIKFELLTKIIQIQQPYIVSLTISRNLAADHISKFNRFLKNKLQAINERTTSFPHEITFGNNHPIITVDVLNHIDGESLEVSGVINFTHSAPISTISKRVADRIRNAVKQLTRDSVNIVVIDTPPMFFSPDCFDVINTLFGDPIIILSKQTKQINTRRGFKRIFGKLNTRISAVVHYRRSFSSDGLVRKITLIPNPFARNPLTNYSLLTNSTLPGNWIYQQEIL